MNKIIILILALFLLVLPSSFAFIALPQTSFDISRYDIDNNSFYFYEEFNGTSLDLSVWTSTLSTAVVSGGTLTMASNVDAWKKLTNTETNYYDMCVDVRLKHKTVDVSGANYDSILYGFGVDNVGDTGFRGLSIPGNTDIGSPIKTITAYAGGPSYLRLNEGHTIKYPSDDFFNITMVSNADGTFQLFINNTHQGVNHSASDGFALADNQFLQVTSTDEWEVDFWRTYNCTDGVRKLNVVPTFSTTSINITNPLQNYSLQIANEVEDDIGLSMVIFAWNDTGTWVNYSNSSDLGASTLLNYTVNVTVTAEGGDVIGVQFLANDTDDNWVVSTLRTFTVATSMAPKLSLNPNNFFNSENSSFLSLGQSKNALINLSLTDDLSLFGVEIYIIHSNGSIVFNVTNTSLSGTSDTFYLYTDVSRGYETAGYYTINVTVWDDHTIKTILNYDIEKGQDYLLFDNVIKISADGAIESNTQKQRDRYNFEFTYSKSPPTKKVFYVESTGVLSYRADSKYKAHFVDWDNKKWIDFEGLGGISIVKKINDYKWQIEFDNADEKVIFSSLGGLNSKIEHYKYYLTNPEVNWFIPKETTSRFSNDTFSVSLNVTSLYRNVTRFWVFNSSQNLVQIINVSELGNGTYFYNYTFLNLNDSTYYINASHFDQTGFSVNSSTITLSIVTFNISVYDEITENLITDRNVTVELVSGIFANNYSTDGGVLSVSGLLNTEYRITYSADLYDKRDYFFTIDDVSDFSVDLYLLSSGNGTEVTFTVQDNSGNELSNALIHLKRYYVSNNSYKIVAMVKTNTEGKAIIDVDFNDAFYETFTTFGDFSLNIRGAKFISTTFIITLNLLADPFETIDGMADIVSSISFNNLTETFSYTYNIKSGATRTGTIEVYKITPTEKNLQCSQSTSSSSATILCVVNTTATAGTYIAEGSVLVGTQNILLKTYEVATGIAKAARGIFGEQGLFLGILLSGTMAGIGAFVSPAVAIIMFLIGIFFSTYFGLIWWGIGNTIILISVIIIGSVIIYKVKS